jgi:hypothetical protein
MLHQARATYGVLKIGSIAGMSGSPVFNLTLNALCGMVLRGSLNANKCVVWYADIIDIVQLLKATRDRMKTVLYWK